MREWYQGEEMWRLLRLMCVILSASSSAVARRYPTTADPSRLPQNFEEPPQPKAQVPLVLPQDKESVLPKKAQSTTFVFHALVIEGAHALPEQEIRALWTHSPGDTVSVAQAFQFAEAVTKVYHHSGYALSFAFVPQQKIEKGTFTLRVVEGFVERVVVEGQLSQRTRSIIERRARTLKGQKPLRTAALERSLLLLNDLPGVRVSGVLSPADSEGGAVLTLKAQQKRFSVSLSYDNYLPKSFGSAVSEVTLEERGAVTGSEAVRFVGRHSFSQDAYSSALGDISLGVGGEGMRVGLSGSVAHIQPNDELLSDHEYRGTTRSMQLYLEYPLVRSRESNVGLGVSFNLNTTKASIRTADLFDDQLRTLQVWGTYDVVDTTRALTFAKLTVIQGLNILGARGSSRATGRVKSTLVMLDAQRDQPLRSDGALFLRLGIRGQVTLSTAGLFSALECAYGGRQFGRAFDSGAITGDHCALGRLAVHWVKRWSPSVLDSYGFVDGGVTWQKGTLEAGEKRSRSASSTGIGFDLHLWKGAEVKLEVARKLQKGQKDWRAAGMVAVQF